MDYNDTNKAFADITTQLTVPASPYEAQPVQQGTKKTLTPKGKVAIAAVALVAAGVGVGAWQSSQAGQAEDGLKAEQVALQRQQTEVELTKARTEADKERVKNFTACVDQGKDKVGDFGQSRMDDLIEKCNAAFPASTELNAEPTGSDGEDGDGMGGWWVIGGALVVGLWMGGKKVAKSVGDNA
jgi:hypothetical protein